MSSEGGFGEGPGFFDSRVVISIEVALEVWRSGRDERRLNAKCTLRRVSVSQSLAWKNPGSGWMEEGGTQLRLID